MASNESFTEKMGYAVNERLINIIIGLLGIVSVFVGILFSDKLGDKWEAVIISVGASLIASAVVSYLSSIYVYKRKREKEITDNWGLISICDNRAQMNIQVAKRLDKAKDHLDIIAFGLKSFRESKRKLIADKVAHGMSIRIITVDPKCDLLKQKDLDEKKVVGSTSDSITQLCRWILELQELGGSKVEIRFCNTLPTELYFRVDDYVYAGPYQCGKESQRTITMEYRSRGEGYKYYRDYFDALWSDKSFCAENPSILHI